MSFLGAIGSAFSGLTKGLTKIPLLGDFAEPIAGLFGGATDYLIAQEEADQNRQWQQYMAQFQHGLNEQSAEAQRNWSSHEADVMRTFNMQEAEKNRQWNSIGEQAKRASAAGLNPLTVAQNAGQSPSIQASQGSTPAGASAAPGTFPSVVPNAILNLQALQSALKMSGESRKLAHETNRYDEQMDALIDKLKTESGLNAVQTDAVEIANTIQRAFGKRKAAADCMNLEYQAYAAAARGDLDEAKILTENMLQKLYKSQNEEIRLRLPFVKQQMESGIELLDQQAKTEKSKQAENYAAAKEHSASAKEHEAGAELKGYEAEISKVEADIKKSNSFAEWKANLYELRALAAKYKNQQLVDDIDTFLKTANDPRDKDKNRSLIAKWVDTMRTWFKGRSSK